MFEPKKYEVIESKKMVSVGTTVPKETHAFIEKLAETNNSTMARVIREMLYYVIDEKK